MVPASCALLSALALKLWSIERKSHVMALAADPGLAFSDAVRFFHANALSSSVAMKVDFDLPPLVIASGLYRKLVLRSERSG